MDIIVFIMYYFLLAVCIGSFVLVWAAMLYEPIYEKVQARRQYRNSVRAHFSDQALEEELRILLAKERAKNDTANSDNSIPLCSDFSNEEIIYNAVYDK